MLFRSHLAGTPGEYIAHKGFSADVFELFGTDGATFEDIVRTHDTDEGVLAALMAIKHPTAEAIATYNLEMTTYPSNDPAAVERLKNYRWPGNVRELENLVRRLAALYTEPVIGLDIIDMELAEPAMSAEPRGAPDGESLTQAVERHLRDFFDAHKDGLPASGLYDRVLREVERPLISLSLLATRGNQIRAAELLGLNRNTLRKKIRELDIQVIRGMKA